MAFLPFPTKYFFPGHQSRHLVVKDQNSKCTNTKDFTPPPPPPQKKKKKKKKTPLTIFPPPPQKKKKNTHHLLQKL